MICSQMVHVNRRAGSCRLVSLEYGLHLLPLPLSEVVRSNALLKELQAPLLLTNSEQLLGPPLIRSKSSNFSDEISHKLVVLGKLSLGVGWLGLEHILGHFVTLFQANANFIPWRHFPSLVEVNQAILAW